MDPTSSRCDVCERHMLKATRVHRGIRYCATCYARIFRRTACRQCGNMARLPADDPSAVCLTCELSQPCARCGKTDYEVGKRTRYGPVCLACAPYFRQPQPCMSCGTLSVRLSTVPRQGEASRLCPKCAVAHLPSCAACYHRRPLFPSTNGKLLCRVCLTKGEIPCATCGKPTPAGQGKNCNSCRLTLTCRRRIRMDQAAFSKALFASAFGEFGEWLINGAGPGNAATSVHRYLSFFVTMEQEWGQIPTYPDLLQHFGAEGLRRVRRPMRWLAEAKGLAVDSRLREQDSEQRRIDALIAEIPAGSASGRSLRTYLDHLTQRAATGKVSLLSVRLALRPAASLLRMVGPPSWALPDQGDLDRYLVKVPGQKSAVTGFVNFLNKYDSRHLVIRIDPQRTALLRRAQLEKALIRLLRDADKVDPPGKWVRVALEYFHGLRVNRSAALQVLDDHDGRGFCVLFGGNQYWLPRLVSADANLSHARGLR